MSATRYIFPRYLIPGQHGIKEVCRNSDGTWTITQGFPRPVVWDQWPDETLFCVDLDPEEPDFKAKVTTVLDDYVKNLASFRDFCVIDKRWDDAGRYEIRIHTVGKIRRLLEDAGLA